MEALQGFLTFVSRHQRRIWKLAALLISTFFLAKLTSLLLGYFLLPVEIDSSQNARFPGGASNLPDRPSISKIIQRNLFNSTNQADKPQVPERPPIDDQEIRPSTISAELLGTVVFNNSRYSAALINNRSEDKTSYYSLGDDLLGSSLVRIERFRVIIQRNGRLESLELQAAKDSIETASASRRRLPRRRVQSPNSEGVDFEELGPGRYLIPEDTVENALANLPSLLRSARAIPNTGPDNRIDGFKIVEIKSDSIFSRIGLRDGDVIKSVNDEALNSMEKGMSLFNAMREKKTIEIDIERNGSRLNYTYEIR